jgi:hypothetical protein
MHDSESAIVQFARTVKEARKSIKGLMLGCHMSFVAHMETPHVNRVFAYAVPGSLFVKRLARILKLEPDFLQEKADAAREEVASAKALIKLARFHDPEGDVAQVLSQAPVPVAKYLISVLPTLLNALATQEGKEGLERLLDPFRLA